MKEVAAIASDFYELGIELCEPEVDPADWDYIDACNFISSTESLKHVFAEIVERKRPPLESEIGGADSRLC